jgi:hypothetical protein
MYDLMASAYEGVTYPIFDRDLAAKSHVILLRDAAGLICGFSTLVLWRFRTGGQPIRILFSGDTIVRRSAWGFRVLPMTFLRIAGACYARSGEHRLYWLLTTKGHRTYRFLRLFFNRYHPGPAQSERRLAALAAEIGQHYFADRYDPRTGILAASAADSHQRLRRELAEIALKDRKRPDVQFFVARNPKFADGDELLCLAELEPGNIRDNLRPVFAQGSANPDILDQRVA